jgi:two-component system, cell cycle response regulator DivK
LYKVLLILAIMMNKIVLIAEDSSVIQNLTRKILEFQDFSIISARNGAEVLKLLSEQSVAVILMDINMPVMDGLECAKAIRKLGNVEKRNTPIIAITGNAKNYTAGDFEAAGINDYLTKPLDFDQLVSKVKEITGS